MLPYNEWKFLYPPRPELAIPSDTIDFYEKQGYVAQVKKNGTCTLIGVDPRGQLHTLTRHNAPHIQWKPDAQSPALRALTRLTGWHVFEAEVLHSKTQGIKDTVYLFDILVHNSQQLVGTTWFERMQLLQQIFRPGPAQAGSHQLDDRLFLAQTLTRGLRKTWQQLQAPEDEGIVLKSPDARLKLCSKIDSNSSWQVKCRRPAANYSY